MEECMFIVKTFCDSVNTVSEKIQQARGTSKICNQLSGSKVWINW